MTALAPVAPVALTAAEDEFPIARLVAQKTAIQRAMKAVMKEGEHYGVIPGTPKPSLWQPGADTLSFLFHLRPDFEEITAIERDDFVFVKIRCRLFHKRTGEEWGSGIGSANSRETKYTKQTSAKVCPGCQKPAIIRSKYNDCAWLCFAKKGGCGAKFAEGDKSIEDQEGQTLPDKVWDLHNTIEKMACKRAKVAAVLAATAASDLFTQDLEDLVDLAPVYTPPSAPAAAPPPAPEPPPAPKAQGESTTPRGVAPATPPRAQRAPTPAPTSAQTAPSGAPVHVGSIGPKPATPSQVKALNIAIGQLPFKACYDRLISRDPSDEVTSALLQLRQDLDKHGTRADAYWWISWKLGRGRKIESSKHITTDEATTLIDAAKRGEMPQ